MSELVCKTLELLAESKGAFASVVKNIFNTKTMATLKISELSVGDWVEWKLYDKTYDMQVSAVTDRRIYGMHDGIEFSMLLTQISPIPITGEILEKNGWSNDGMYATLRIETSLYSTSPSFAKT